MRFVRFVIFISQVAALKISHSKPQAVYKSVTSMISVINDNASHQNPALSLMVGLACRWCSRGFPGLNVIGTVVPFPDTVKLLSCMDRHVTGVLLPHVNTASHLPSDDVRRCHSVVLSRRDYRLRPPMHYWQHGTSATNVNICNCKWHRTHWTRGVCHTATWPCYLELPATTHDWHVSSTAFCQRHGVTQTTTVTHWLPMPVRKTTRWHSWLPFSPDSRLTIRMDTRIHW